MNLSNDGFVAFHYRSYGTFFLQQNRLHNIHRGFTHYKYYRAFLFYQNVTYPKIIFRFYLFVIGHLSQAIILTNPLT